ncbi:hypothetical protein ALC62_12023, partial [Cyphomyrmex costatus]
EDEVLSNFIPEESRAIGISIVHLHNSRSATDRKNAHVAASNHDRLTSPLLFPVYQDVLDYRTPLLPDDVRAGERGARGTGGTLSVYASRHVSTMYNGFQSATADIINKTPQCVARCAV